MTVSAPPPGRGRRDALAVPALALVGVWAAGALLIASEWLLQPSLRVGTGLLPAVSGLYFLVLIGTANVVVVGLILAVVAAARTPPRRALRAIVVGFIVTGGVVSQFWIAANLSSPTRFFVTQDDRSTAAAELFTIAIAVVLVTAALLRVLGRGGPRSRSSGTDETPAAQPS